MTRMATLGMYDFPWTRTANDALWAAVAAELGRRGVAAIPQALERARPLHDLWRDDRLLLGQTCGYPLTTALAGQVTLVATPRYALPGCAGAWHCSVVVVGAEATGVGIADFRGRTAAINGRDSNTGMNLLRAVVAPVAEGKAFFGAVIETGAHLASLAAIRAGTADIAAIDCVTHGLVQRHRPDLLQGTRILGETPRTPALPFVTRLGVSQAELDALRQALAAVLAAPEHAPIRATLALEGIEVLPLSAYDAVLDLERAAARLGYPDLV